MRKSSIGTAVLVFAFSCAATAQAVPGNGQGSPPPHSAAAGGPPANGLNQGGGPPAQPGQPTAPPGNSGSNPHGGPPGITGQPPATPAGPPSTPPGQTPPAPTQGAQQTTQAAPGNGNANGNGNGNGNGTGPGGKIEICHATGSATNPFVRIEISINGLNGHLHHSDDIIPAPPGGCASEPEGSRGDIDICHRVGPDQFEVVSVPVEDLDQHQGEGDIIPAPTGGCPGLEPSGVLGETGGGGAPAGGSGPTDGTGASVSASNAGGDSLPFTGLLLGGLAATALACLVAGLAARRASRAVS